MRTHLMVDPDTGLIVQEGRPYSVIRHDQTGLTHGNCSRCSRAMAFTIVETYTPQRPVSYQNRPVRARFDQAPVCAEHAQAHVEQDEAYAYAVYDQRTLWLAEPQGDGCSDEPPF
ncbi:hypothetical protein [Streptosporangium sp. CA-115845]|uniref:hypothetical protein n=1 Tax=Streptosporangium sp. CA-115845 TaxID=3240071 RepID=UPI003D9406BE